MASKLSEALIITEPFIFRDYIEPKGYLPNTAGANGLWHYYVIARRNYEEMIDPIILEGERDPEYNFRQLFKSLAQMYGIEPETMAKHWQAVDMQATHMHLPLLPAEERYRFTSSLIINLH